MGGDSHGISSSHLDIPKPQQDLTEASTLFIFPDQNMPSSDPCVSYLMFFPFSGLAMYVLIIGEFCFPLGWCNFSPLERTNFLSTWAMNVPRRTSEPPKLLIILRQYSVVTLCWLNTSTMQFGIVSCLCMSVSENRYPSSRQFFLCHHRHQTRKKSFLILLRGGFVIRGHHSISTSFGASFCEFPRNELE